jgi:hypothetical protein
MVNRQRPKIRHCPVCGIAMQASKTHENAADFDKFDCLTCHTVILESTPRSSGSDNG